MDIEINIDQFKQERQEMVAKQIAARGVKDPKVLEAMERVPREMFMDPITMHFAYEDSPLPIEEGQTISQPFIVAWMAEQAQLNLQDKVLEIGTGSGYSAAILSLLSAHVYSIERHATLAKLAVKRFQQLGFANITVLVGDGTLGWSDHAPYDAIIVTAGGPQVPPSLLKQLAIGGRLIIPVGPTLKDQQLTRVTRKGEENYCFEPIGAVRFVPLLGEEGWKIDQ
jgi:protein-L-isoaspartate(D-aspartate) O-methyltransferase